MTKVNIYFRNFSQNIRFLGLQHTMALSEEEEHSGKELKVKA